MEIPGSFLHELINGGLLIPTGVDGVFLRSIAFEKVVDAIDAMVGRLGAGDKPEVLRFPPVMPSAELVKSGYLKSFPHLLGTVHCFCGNEAEHRAMLRCLASGEEWTTQQQPADVLLTPAACYPLYPVIAARGPLPPSGGLYDMHSWCFRHEPSSDPARMQSFRVREFVRIGSETQVMSFREGWIERAQVLADDLALPFAVDTANDPFFGRPGRLMAESQRDRRLKYELLVPVNSAERPTACMSFNYHMNHFGEAWHIVQSDETLAHSGCVGFGLERLALALFRHHGLNSANWPGGVLQTLGLKQ